MSSSEHALHEQHLPPQHQSTQPGLEHAMHPRPQAEMRDYRGNGRLKDEVAIITGGDSGIGRAVAIGYAKEGADVVVVYLDEDDDAQETSRLIEEAGRRCLLLKGDIGQESFCNEVIEQTLERFERLDILVNNAGEQHPQASFEQVSNSQIERTFRTNVFAMFNLARAALPYLRGGGRIINTASITAYRGHETLVDYSASKGAIVSFTRSLAKSLIKDGIRVNAVAPGPVWTPLIPSTFTSEEVSQFGSHAPMKRAGQPDEIAPSFIFLATSDSTYMSGQVLHPNGGEPVNG